MNFSPVTISSLYFTLHSKMKTTFVHVFSLQGQYCVVMDDSQLKVIYSEKK
jgi:hypothetical protein